MAMWSRNGCIECKRAKVKCDELHPFCGTCTRRGRKCTGYQVGSTSHVQGTFPKNTELQDHLAPIPVTCDVYMRALLRTKALSAIPHGSIQPADEPYLEVYFMRHPKELVFSSEFTDEMNHYVYILFQNDPSTVSDNLSAIGATYLGGANEKSLMLLLDRKTRILARLRMMSSIGNTTLELILSTLLAICAIEVSMSCLTNDAIY